MSALRLLSHCRLPLLLLIILVLRRSMLGKIPCYDCRCNASLMRASRRPGVVVMRRGHTWLDYPRQRLSHTWWGGDRMRRTIWSVFIRQLSIPLRLGRSIVVNLVRRRRRLTNYPCSRHKLDCTPAVSSCASSLAILASLFFCLSSSRSLSVLTAFARSTAS